MVVGLACVDLRVPAMSGRSLASRKRAGTHMNCTNMYVGVRNRDSKAGRWERGGD